MKRIFALIFLSMFLSGCSAAMAGGGSAAYFGVLSPDRFLPEKCTMPAGLACLDFTANTEEVTVIIMNDMGYDMGEVELNLVDANKVSLACSPEGNEILEDSEQEVFTCSGKFKSGKLKAVLEFTYKNMGNELRSTKAGEIIAMVEG